MMRVLAVSLLASPFLCSAEAAPPSSKAEAFAAALRGGRIQDPAAAAVALRGERGFADVDPESDQSMKMIENANLHHPHAGHKTVRPRATPGRDAHARAIQNEVESMVHRVKLLSDDDAFEFIKELDDIEDNLALSSSDDKGLVQEISTVRADLCARKGFKGADTSECEAFMHKACGIEGIGVDADAPPIVPEEDCLKFYSQDAMASAAVPAPASAPAAAPVVAPAPKEPDGWSMKVRPLPEQGFQGQLKEHEDMDTATSDWRREFGPKSGFSSFQEICAQYPKNEWCRLHGYHRPQYAAAPLRSAAAKPFALGAFAAAVALQAALGM